MKYSNPIPSFKELPSELFFRHDDLEAMEWDAHSHPWGQLNYISHGVMNIEIDGVRYLSPPQYAVWIPPFFVHFSYTLSKAVFRSVYVNDVNSALLPARPCTMKLSPVLRAIFDDFAIRSITIPITEQDLRMTQVALDQILNLKIYDNYLPYASSSDLTFILNELQINPGDRRSISVFADLINMTSRSLERKCQRELGLSFGEWRLRLKFMYALECLDAGHTVQKISYDLGYSTPSAFIVMFRRFAGTTPDNYRTTYSNKYS